MTYDHYLQLLDLAKTQIAKRVQGLQPRAGNNVSVIGDGISVDPIVREGDEVQTPPRWVFVILAVITADQTTTGLPEDTGLFVAGVVGADESVSNQGDFQTNSQVINVTGGVLYRRITTTLYASTLYPEQITDAELGIYRGSLRITLELVGPSGVYSTFSVDATSGGVTFATEAPTDDEFYFLRFVSAERL